MNQFEVSDYEKLVGYKNEIGNLVDYDYDAAAGNYFDTDIDPWQLISVFDGDSSTNVVCEGYSKAFMYLCDMTAFAGDVACYTVSGTLDGGNHMWNVVGIGGKHYLADVTNANAATELFLVGSTMGSAANGYSIDGLSYIYDSDTIGLWGTDGSSILTLEAESYDPNGTDEDVISGTCGDNLTWTLVDGVLTISGTGEMCILGGSGSAPWNSVCDQFVKVIVEEGITSISSSAFYGCNNLIEIQLPDSLQTLEPYAIMNCNSLTQITLPNNVSTIFYAAVCYCDSFVSYFVKEGNPWFAAVDGVLFDKNTTNLISYPSGKKAECYDIPNTVISVGPSAFESNHNLREVSIPDSTKEIQNNAFYNCAGLTTVSVGAQVNNVGYFDGCLNLEKVIVAENNETYAAIDGVLFSKDGLSLVCFPAGRFEELYSVPVGTENIEAFAFADSSLRSIELPQTIKSLGEFAFSGSRSLTRIIIPESVTNIGQYAFSYSSYLSEIIFCGDAPAIDDTAFMGLTPKCYYPSGNENWAAVTAQPFVDNLIEWINYDPANHLEERIPGMEATCTENGLTEGKVCLICGVTTVAQETIPAKGHTEEIIPGKEATCTENGLTEGKQCTSCGMTTVAQETIPPTGHNYTDGVCEDCGSGSGSGGSGSDGSGDGSGTGSGSGTGNDSGGDTDTSVAKDFSWSLENGVLTISGHGAMPEFAEISGISNLPWYLRRYEILSVVIEEGITSICYGAFDACYNLRNVSIPQSVTSIGASAFNACQSLTAVTIPDKVTEIKEDTFCACYSLETLSLGNSVESIDMYAFAHSAISELFLPASVKQITGGAFWGCEKLAKITVNKENPAFLAHKNVLFTQDMSELMLYPAANSRSTYTIPDGVKRIAGYAFSYATNLQKIEIPNTVNDLGYDTFEKCTSLLEIAIPAGVTTIGRSVFEGCTSLTQVDLPNTITDIGMNAFYECTALKEIILPEGIITIGSVAFYGCSFSKLSIPSSVIAIGDGAFANCSKLQKIVIPKNVKSLGNVFNGCHALSQITVEKGNANYSSVNGVLYGNRGKYLMKYPPRKSGRSFTVPKNVEEISAGAFENCVYLQEIEFNDKVTNIDNSVCAGCSNLTNVTIPEGVIRIGYSAFSGCGKLTSISLPDSILVIDAGAFEECSSLREIDIPKNISSIENCLLWGCESLSSISIPSNIKVIGDYAFVDCLNLKKITFEGDAPTIGCNVFSGVNATAFYPANNATWKNNVRQQYGGTILWKSYSNGENLEILTSPKITGSNVASSGKPRLTWVKVEGAVKYEIWRSTKMNGGFTRIWTQKGTTYTNTKAVAGTKYYYKVKAVDAEGNVSDFSNRVGRMCDLARPNVTATNVASSGKIKLTWKAVDGAVKYQIWRSTTGKTGSFKRIWTQKGTTYINTNAQPGVKYYYKVKAVHSNTNANSAFSVIDSRMCDLARPVVNIKLNIAGDPRISWQKVEGAVKYEVWRSTSKNGKYTKIATTKNLYQVNKNAVAGKTYYYKVKAIHSNTNANSAFSTIKYIKAK